MRLTAQRASIPWQVALPGQSGTNPQSSQTILSIARLTDLTSSIGCAASKLEASRPISLKFIGNVMPAWGHIDVACMLNWGEEAAGLHVVGVLPRLDFLDRPGRGFAHLARLAGIFTQSAQPCQRAGRPRAEIAQGLRGGPLDEALGIVERSREAMENPSLQSLDTSVLIV